MTIKYLIAKKTTEPDQPPDRDEYWARGDFWVFDPEQAQPFSENEIFPALVQYNGGVAVRAVRIWIGDEPKNGK